MKTRRSTSVGRLFLCAVRADDLVAGSEKAVTVGGNGSDASDESWCTFTTSDPGGWQDESCSVRSRTQSKRLDGLPFRGCPLARQRGEHQSADYRTLTVSHYPRRRRNPSAATRRGAFPGARVADGGTGRFELVPQKRYRTNAVSRPRASPQGRRPFSTSADMPASVASRGKALKATRAGSLPSRPSS